MKRISIASACFFVAFSSAFAEFPVGQWSNKKEGFKIVGFGLRSNGVGYFSSSISQMTTVVRWKKDGDAIKITIAAPPENPTLTFLSTGDPKVGRLTMPGQEPQEFYLVDVKEPEDLEAMARARAKEEAAKRKKSFTREDVKIASVEALMNEVQQFAKITEGMGSCSITAKDWPTGIQLTRTNKRISVKVNLEESRAKEQSPNLTYSYRTEEPKSDLPRTIYVPAKKRAELRTWADSNSLKHEFAFYQAKGTWGLEGHFAFFSAYIDEDPESLSDVIRYISGSVFDKETSEFVITYVKRQSEPQR